MIIKEKEGKAFIVDKADAALSIFMDDEGTMRSEMTPIKGLDEAIDNLIKKTDGVKEQASSYGVAQPYSNDDEDDDDEEDFLDEPDVKVEPKTMKDMEMIDPLEGIERIDMG